MFKLFPEKWTLSLGLRYFLGLILLLLIIIFLYLKVVPSGEATYKRTWPGSFKSGKGFIYGFNPAIRLAGENDSREVKIIAEPVYFSLYAPRTFDEAVLTIKYDSHLDLDSPIIEAGLIKDKITRSAEIKPLENRVLSGLSSSWLTLVKKDGYLVLQKKANYNQISEFDSALRSGHLKNCPGGPRTCVAVYNYQLEAENNYSEIKNSPLVINQSWRGAHQFFVYLNRGSYRFDFDFNIKDGDNAADPIKVNLYLGSKILNSQDINNDSKKEKEPLIGKKNLFLEGYASSPGIYRIELKVSDDVIISRISSPSDHLAFINHIWPVGELKTPSLYTDASYLQARTTEAASLGKIFFGGRVLSLERTYEQFMLSGIKDNKEIKLAQSDVILENNGVFSLFPGGLVNPNYKKIDRNFALEDNLEYIIANYNEPQESGRLKVAQAKFNLKDAFYDNNKYNFVISIPGLSGSTTSANYLEIKEIRIALKGKTLWQKIFQ